MINDQLKKLGFNKAETSAYLTLLELGQSRANDLIEKTKTHRNLVYKALHSLEDKNLVTKTIVSGVAEFSANSLNYLLEDIENKKAVIKTAVEELAEKNKQNESSVEVYEGLDGIKSSINKTVDNLQPNQILNVLSTDKSVQNIELEKHWKKYSAQATKKGASVNVMMEEPKNEVAKQRFDRRKSQSDVKIKILPSDINSPLGVVFSEDVLNIIVQGDKTFTVNISDKAAVEGFQKYFDHFWNLKVKTYSGWEEIKRLFTEEIIDDVHDGLKTYVIGAGYGESKDDKRVQELFNEHTTLLIEKGAEKHALLYEMHRDKIFRDLQKTEVDKTGQYKARFLPDSYYNPMEIHIFNTIATITIFSDEPISIAYRDPKAIEGFRKQFEMLWGVAKF